MRLEAKLAYMNSVTGETHGNLPDAEDAYWAYIAANGQPAGAVAWTDVTGKPATFAPTIGTTATTAMAGNKVATSTQRGGVLLADAQANSVATDAAGLVTDFNALLAKLRTAGVISV